MPRHKPLADGSAAGARPESPCVRAIDSYMTLGARADKLSSQLDHVTVSGFSAGVTLKEDDSLVIVLADFMTDDD